MFGFITKKDAKAFEDRIKALETEVAEMKKKTISQRTTEETPVPFSQIMDEWLNGGKEEENGN